MELVDFRDGGGVVITAKLYDGVPFGPLTGDVKKHLDEIQDFSFTDDDVCVISYPRSGTHWCYEIVNMLKKGSATYFNELIPTFGLNTANELEITQQPRVFGSHLFLRHMPKGFLERRLKIVHVYRNPKDIAVSYFNFLKNVRLVNYENGEWKHFLPMFLNGEVLNGNWYDFMKEWKDFSLRTPDYPMMWVSFEELKRDLETCVRRISSFLGTGADEQLINDITDKCRFHEMHKEKNINIPPQIQMVTRTEGNVFYWKGKVGEWKNWFTISQHEQFDEAMDQKLKELRLPFRFT